MSIRVIDEYNENGHLLYVEDYLGAYARGRTREEALIKLPDEIERYMAWLYDNPKLNMKLADSGFEVVQEKKSELHIEDADSDVIFDSEKLPLSESGYAQLKAAALKSARDFLALYSSVPDKEGSCIERRSTFYGEIPTTAHEMYEHTKNVNSYYFGEIGAEVDNDGDILSCRERGFAILENQPDFLKNKVYDGSYGEQWSLRKVLRRFIWHDRIHARAMYRMAVKICGHDAVLNPFKFAVPMGAANVVDVVAALIWDGKKFLACRRPAHKARGLMWEFVGGKVEKGETREQALSRECREELDVVLRVGTVFTEVTHVYPDITVHLIVYNAEIAEGEPKLLEHVELAWVSPERIGDYEFCPADISILNMIQETHRED